MSGNKAPKDARLIAQAKKADRALELRIKGYKLEDIAPEIGLRTRAGVKKLIDRAIKRLPQENAEQLRVQQRERLYALVKILMNELDANPGNLDAMDRLLRTEKRLAELEGLDAPTKQELTGKDGEPLNGPTAAEAARLVREAFGSHAAKRDDLPIEPGEVSSDSPKE